MEGSFSRSLTKHGVAIDFFCPMKGTSLSGFSSFIFVSMLSDEFLFIFIYLFIYITWRLITLQYCSGFVIHWHESAMDLHVFPILIPPPTSLSTRSLWVFPVHQVRALISCIQPGLVICFTLDNIHVLMLFSRNIPPSPSPTESKRLFYTSVSLLLSRM